MKSSLRILHLEDDPNDAELIRTTLVAEGIDCDVLRVSTRTEFIAALEKDVFDLILVDYSLPQFDGLSALTITQEKCPDVPFIIISGAIGEELAIEILKKGATDYVLKNKLSHLVPSIKRALREVEERAERKRAEETLRASEENFRAVVENANDAILVGVGEGSHVYANQQAADITGYCVAELLKTTIKELAHPDEIEKIMQIFRRRLEGEPAPRRYETTIIRKDGKSVPIEVAGTKIVWQGKIADMVFFRDITERKKAVEALRESEEKFRTLFDNASDAIFIHDMEGHFLEVNRVAYERLGYSREELLQMTTMDIDTPKYAALVLERTELLVKSGYFLAETAHVRRDGTVIPIELSTRIIEYAGSPAVLSIARDITERKKAEEDLKKRVKELEEFYDMAVGRELRMKELKEEIESLKEELEKYKKS